MAEFKDLFDECIDLIIDTSKEAMECVREGFKDFTEPAQQSEADLSVCALLDAGISDTKTMVLLNKYWGISRDDAKERVVRGKRRLAISNLREYMELQGYSGQQIDEYLQTKHADTVLKKIPSLLALYNEPAQLFAELEKISIKPKQKEQPPEAEAEAEPAATEELAATEPDMADAENEPAATEE